MDLNQLNSLNNLISQYKEIDFASIMADVYKGQPDINGVIIGKYTGPEIVSITNRIFKQLEEEINGGHRTFLPFQYNYQNEFGNGNLQNDLQSILNFINQRNPNSLASLPAYVDRLVFYQISNGFWDKSVRKIHQADEIELNKLHSKLDTISQHLNKYSDVIGELISSLNNEKQKLSEFINQKNNELQQISNSLQTVRNQSNEISNLLNNSTANNEKINSLIEQQKMKVEELDRSILEQKNTFEGLKKLFDKTIGEAIDSSANLKGQVDEFKSHLSFTESKRGYFEERNSYLDELIGREVGVSLFETFKQRKGELNSSVTFWKWAVPVMTIATIAWIFFLFNGHTSITDISQRREFFAINTLKSIPAIFLLLFSISQYAKERNFQEEYAFKSAVALTIDAYANRLQDANNRDKLILEAVIGVYKSPIGDKTSKEDFKTKTALETMKNMSDTVKEVVKGAK